MKKITHKHTWRITILGMIAFMITTSPGNAEIPHLLNYQGVLSDNAGHAIHGTRSVTFRIYTQQEEGTALWEETHADLQVFQGNFSVLLGGVNALTLPFDEPYWLGIQIGDDTEMTPRQQLTSVGYAYRAKFAENVPEGIPTERLDQIDDRISDNWVMTSYLNFKLASYMQTNALDMQNMYVDFFTDDVGIDLNQSTNYVFRREGNHDIVVEAPVMLDEVGSYMINTATPGSAPFVCYSETDFVKERPKNIQRCAQSFRVNQRSSLYRVTVVGQSDSTKLTGDIVLEICEDDNNKIGKTLITVNKSASDLLEHDHHAFDFSYPVRLDSNQPYWLVLDFSNVPAVVRDGKRGVLLWANFASSYNRGRFITGYRGIASWFPQDNTTLFFKLFTSAPDPNSTAEVISNRFTLEESPSEVFVMADEETEAGSITYYFSRDDGGTWGECRLNELENVDALGAGNQYRWKAILRGDAELNAIGIGF